MIICFFKFFSRVWNTWVKNSGKDLGLIEKDWTSSANPGGCDSKGKAFNERALEYAKNYGDKESGAAEIKIKFNYMM